MSLRPDLNGYPHICDYAGHVCDTADADRRWLVTGIQDRWPLLPVSMAAILNFGCRQTSDKVDKVIFMSGMVENMGVEIGIAAPSITVKKIISTSGLAVAILNFGNVILISGN